MVRWTIVAMHNGDFDRAQLQSHRESLIAGIKRLQGVDVEWWDASHKVELALSAPAYWYSKSLAMTGTSHAYPNEGDSAEFFAGFERFNQAITNESIAEQLSLPSIDRIAWKQFRDPPPMVIFVKHFARMLRGSRPPQAS